MRVGVLMLPTDPWPETMARARRIEALGYDHLWTYDHLSWRRYRGRRWYSALPWLTGIAGATERIRLGTMVASPNLRHPVTLAQDAVTLDHISDGRLDLGVGAGGIGFDATVFGKEVLSRPQLVARLTEFVELLSRVLTEDVVSYDGRYYTATDACVEPKPVQTPRLPIAIAAGGKRTLELTARLGDAWITYGDKTNGDRSTKDAADSLRSQVRRLEDTCGAIGRDPMSIRRIYMTDNTGERPLASVSAFTDFVGQYSEFGFTDVVFHHPRADDPVWNDPEKIVEEIATEVLPNLHS